MHRECRKIIKPEKTIRVSSVILCAQNNKEDFLLMFETEHTLGIVVADKDGIIKSVRRSNGSLPSSLIGTKWYDAYFDTG